MIMMNCIELCVYRVHVCLTCMHDFVWVVCMVVWHCVYYV